MLFYIRFTGGTNCGRDRFVVPVLVALFVCLLHSMLVLHMKGWPSTGWREGREGLVVEKGGGGKRKLIKLKVKSHGDGEFLPVVRRI